MEELQAQVKYLGGRLIRDKAVSPPPMPDITLCLGNPDSEGHTPQSLSALEKENFLLKQRIILMEAELDGFQDVSADVSRSSCILHVMSSISIGKINEDVLVS